MILIRLKDNSLKENLPHRNEYLLTVMLTQNPKAFST